MSTGKKSVMKRLMGIDQSILSYGVCSRTSSKLTGNKNQIVFVDGVPLFDSFTFEEAGFNFEIIRAALKRREKDKE